MNSEKCELAINKGLEGIIVDVTSISDVDGKLGKLIYRDYSIHELCQQEKWPFLRVCSLVLNGKNNLDKSTSQLMHELKKYEVLTKREEKLIEMIGPVHPMRLLQSIIPILDFTTESTDAYQRGIEIIAKVPLLLAGHYRLSQGRAPIHPYFELTANAQFLALFNGIRPTKDEVALLDLVQILQMEHSFNASTFATRVTASTLANVEVALAVGVGTLSGPLHGGADQAALEFALQFDSVEAAREKVLELLLAKKKIMGMGHAIYKVVDPRAKILKPMAQKLCAGTPFQKTFDILTAIEETTSHFFEKQGKQVHANVEFYKGLVFYRLGIPPKYFTSLFAMARLFGYLAHYLECQKNNKLIRPSALYVSN